MYFCIHCSGIVLKDLVAIDAQAKDYSSSSEQLVNMGKYRMLWNQLKVLRRTQLTSPAIQVDLDHMRILRVTKLHIHVYLCMYCGSLYWRQIPFLGQS